MDFGPELRRSGWRRWSLIILGVFLTAAAFGWLVASGFYWPPASQREEPTPGPAIEAVVKRIIGVESDDDPNANAGRPCRRADRGGVGLSTTDAAQTRGRGVGSVGKTLRRRILDPAERRAEQGTPFADALRPLGRRKGERAVDCGQKGGLEAIALGRGQRQDSDPPRPFGFADLGPVDLGPVAGREGRVHRAGRFIRRILVHLFAATV